MKYRSKWISFLAAAVLVAVVSSSRSARAQVYVGGTFSGPHGTVSFNSDPYVYSGSYCPPTYHRTYYRTYYRYPRVTSSYYPAYNTYPRHYRLRRVFVAFP